MQHSHAQRTRRQVATATFLAMLIGTPSFAQKEEVEKDIKKLAADTSKAFVDGVMKVVQKRLLAKIEKLQTDLQARDKKIAESDKKIAESAKKIAESAKKIAESAKKITALEKRLQELEEKLAAATAPEHPNAFLGVAGADAPKKVTDQLKATKAVVVTEVQPGSPAAGAGIQKGDVILSINNNPVTAQSLAGIVRRHKPGTKVKVVVAREGKSGEKELTIGDRTKVAEKPAPKPPVQLGLVAAEIDGGLSVLEVDKGFTGDVAGIKVGDRITRLNGQDVKTLAGVKKVLGGLVSGEKFTIQTQRGEETFTLTVVGSSGKSGAKLVATAKSKPPKPKAKPDAQPKSKPKPKPAKKAAYLGIDALPESGGVQVTSVVAETAASAYGLKKGDVITKANGAEVKDIAALQGVLGKLHSGDKLSLVVTRGGKTVELKEIVLAAKGEKVKPPPAPKKPAALGLIAQETVDGKVLVKKTRADGAAAKAGLQSGDEILVFNGKKVAGFDALEKALESLHAGDKVKVRVKRGEEEKEMEMTLGERKGV